jgi:hypothetical protein
MDLVYARPLTRNIANIDSVLLNVLGETGWRLEERNYASTPSPMYFATIAPGLTIRSV